MKKLLAFAVCLLLAAATFAQGKASLKGVLIDSVTKSKLEFATVAVVFAKDTTLISYTLSLKDGSFKLTGIPIDRETKIIISYAGYKTYRKVLDLKPNITNDLEEIILAGTTLKEVTVRGERTPISIRKDTIEFNTEAFKTRPNAMVEEMLRLFPAVQVEFDGTIKYNGKVVSKLLIDGKRFFGTDPQVATKNLTADMFDKVQIYDDREDDPDHKLTDNEVGKIINLKLKNAIKKATTGLFYAGGGNRDRYTAGGIVNTFRDTLQFSVLGASNNLGQTTFDSQDLNSLGGFRRAGTTGGSRGILNRQTGGIERIITGGFNVNNDYGKRLKTNLSYIISNNDRENNTKGFNEQNLPGTVLSRTSINASNNNSTKHTVAGLIESVPDTIKRIRFSPTVSFNPSRQNDNGSSSSYNSQIPKINDIINTNASQPFANAYNHTLSYYTKLGHRGKSFNFVQSLMLNKNGADAYNTYNLTSYTASLASQVYDRFTGNVSQFNRADFSFTYTNPISKKLSWDVATNTRFVSTFNHVNTFDRNTGTGVYDQFLPSQSNNLDRTNFIQNFKPQITIMFGKGGQLRGGFDFETQHIVNKFNANIPDLVKQYYFLFPTLSYYNNGLSISYSQYVNQTDVSQVQPITREINNLTRFIGNPDLEPNRVHNIDAYFNKYIADKQISYNLTLML